VRVNTVSPGVVRTSVWENPHGLGGKLAAMAGAEHAVFLRQIPQAFRDHHRPGRAVRYWAHDGVEGRRARGT
jgi:hypothetical protein